MDKYPVPVFIPPEGAPTSLERMPRGKPRSIPDHIAAAIRWDYEHGLMAIDALAAKWREHASRSTVKRIAYGEIYRDVQAAQGDEPPTT
jgi:hypothetical protein